MIHDEQAYVVDEEDTVLTTKNRDEVTTNERVRIVAIWVENLEGELLIAQRAKSMNLDPGLWGPSAAGGVKVGSNYEPSAKEELLEEIGLDVETEKLELKMTGKMCYETQKNGKRMCGVFKVIVDWPIEKFTIEPKEVEAIKWINKADLIEDIAKNPSMYLPSAQIWHDYF